MKKTISQLPQESYLTALRYIRSIGEDPEDFEYEASILFEPEEIFYWLQTKVKFEGSPYDLALIDKIGKDQVIENPILVDVDENLTVEGTHRLSAGIKFHLPVPIIFLSRRKI